MNLSYSGEAGAGGQDCQDARGGGRDNPGDGRDNAGPALLAILVAHGFNLFCLHPSCNITILPRPTLEYLSFSITSGFPGVPLENFSSIGT